MRILITGGAGYIGSHTVRLFRRAAMRCGCTTTSRPGHRAAVPAGRLIVGDLAETDRLDHVLLDDRIEAVVHFAASALVGESVRQPGQVLSQ